MAADFSTDVSAWVDRARLHAQLYFRSLVFALVNRVKALTPVDTGFLRANWTVIIYGDPEPVAGRVPDPAKTLLIATIGQVLVIVNPVVYARRIEFGFVGEDSAGRHYNQQGRHMMAQTVSEIPSIAAATLARLGG